MITNSQPQLIIVPEDIVCARCGAQIPSPSPRSITSGYGIDNEGNKVCYACCASDDMQYMRDHDRITLYLTIPTAQQIAPSIVREVWRHTRRGVSTSRTMSREGVKITNWPSSLEFTPRALQWSVHNFGLPRYDVWFTFEGAIWHGVKIGNNTDLLHCRKNKSQPQPTPRPHYIAGAGLHGYLYQCCDWFDTRTDAAQYIADIHELSNRAMLRLRRDRYIELDIHVHGNEYAEITECYCDTPEVHSDQ